MRRSAPVTVDGRLDEAAWADAPPVTHLVQRSPKEGAAASEPTEVRVLFDDDAIYVGARLRDTSPDSIVAQLARRDRIT
ncbi:MAG TPA: sugar-binding protein, partial [Gemmatimonadales bacterium]|nr:sugar-binding protein [Gemmatimonadales bacterium]